MTDDLRTRIAAVLNANLPVMEFLRPGDTEYAADAVIRELRQEWRIDLGYDGYALCRCGHSAERHDNFGLGQCCRHRECGCWSFKDYQPFRDELVDLAVWLLKEEPGEGHEEKLVDTYLAGLGAQFRDKVTNLILTGEHYEEVDGDDG